MQEYNSTTYNNGNGMEIDPLVNRLKKEDAKNLLTFKRFMWIYIVFIIFYSIVFIFNPIEKLEWIYRLTGVCYVSAFIIFALLFRRYYREYRTIDYSLPVSEMLGKAAERYSLKYRQTWWIVFPLLLIDGGVTLTYFQRLTEFTPWQRIGLVQAVYIPVLLLAMLAGLLIWYKSKKPLRDAALKLLHELQD